LIIELDLRLISERPRKIYLELRIKGKSENKADFKNKTVKMF